MLKQAALFVVVALCSSLIVQAQPVLTPKNVALGGGGSTYITDYNANFYNPANLFISDRIRNFDFGLAITGTYFNGVQNFSGLDDQRSNLQDYLYAYKPGSYGITATERNDIVADNYIRNRTTSLHQTRLEGTLLGLKFRNEKRAISLAIRNRTASSFEVGRGWYSTVLQESESDMVLDRTLIHRYQSMYEISVGYAESFRFFTDMTPRLDELTFGIAPKLVLAGPYQEAIWQNKYVENSDGSYSLIQNFEFRSTGSFSEALEQYWAGVPIETALTNSISDNVFDVQGYGAGVDIGLTYLITLGSDLSTISTDQRTRKSLRFSFSITDIGFVNYDESPTELIIGLDTAAASLPTNLSNESFVGAPGQFLSFVVNHGASNPLTETTLQSGSKQVLLPTAIHGGILFEINRLKLMGDLSVGLTNNAYNSTKLVASAGVELRPLPFLPLRAGTQLATELPSFFSFGTGIETKFWDISIATQFVSRTFSDNPTLSGVTVAVLQFHL